MKSHELFMHRCIQLAKLGAGYVAPNPMVGAVLVYNERVIGEGYHRKYGEAHAEVNCLNSVSIDDQQFISQSTLYVSLEPCAHFGKTPPCADLIIHNKIPEVVVGCADLFSKVNGKGIEKLTNAGIEVIVSSLENECIELNKRFFTFHQQQRPFVILKWAQSANMQIANADRSRVLITNEFTNRLVHKWRSEEAGILVGTNTALYDNPSLTTRKWKGKNAVRLVLDASLRLPTSSQIFDHSQRTIIFNKIKHEECENTSYYMVNEDVSLVRQVLSACYQLNIQSIIVEGGAQLLQSFIDENIWDEARVLTNTEMMIKDGLQAPALQHELLVKQETIFTDTINFYKNL